MTDSGTTKGTGDRRVRRLCTSTDRNTLGLHLRDFKFRGGLFGEGIFPGIEEVDVPEQKDRQVLV